MNYPFYLLHLMKCSNIFPLHCLIVNCVLLMVNEPSLLMLSIHSPASIFNINWLRVMFEWQDLWASLLYSSLLETEAQSPCDSHSGRLQIETALQTVCVQWILTGYFSLGCDVQSDCRRPCRNNSSWILRRKHIQPNNDKIIHYLENIYF